MSASVPTREVARRAFAAEFNDATYTFKESDDDRAPVYSLLPTGQRANRVFIVGTLTETEDVGDDSEYWRGRIVDPTGTFFAYAGQYQPEATSVLRETETPAYVAVVGKPRTYETDEGDVNVSLRPESSMRRPGTAGSSKRPNGPSTESRPSMKPASTLRWPKPSTIRICPSIAISLLRHWKISKATPK